MSWSSGVKQTQIVNVSNTVSNCKWTEQPAQIVNQIINVAAEVCKIVIKRTSGLTLIAAAAREPAASKLGSILFGA